MMDNRQLEKRASLARVVHGIRNVFPETQTLHLSGEAYSAEQLAELVQSIIDVDDELLQAQARLRDARDRKKNLESKGRAVVDDLRTVILAMFGPRSVQAAEFGFTSKS